MTRAWVLGKVKASPGLTPHTTLRKSMVMKLEELLGREGIRDFDRLMLLSLDDLDDRTLKGLIADMSRVHDQKLDSFLRRKEAFLEVLADRGQTTGRETIHQRLLVCLDVWP